MIVLNKISTVEPVEARRIHATLEALNPGALVISTDYAQAPLEHILSTQRFNMNEASRSKVWLRELAGEPNWRHIDCPRARVLA